MSDLYYIGYSEKAPELFQASGPQYATPEVTGYDSVEGPFQTREEAEAAMPSE